MHIKTFPLVRPFAKKGFAKQNNLDETVFHEKLTCVPFEENMKCNCRQIYQSITDYIYTLVPEAGYGQTKPIPGG